MSDSTDDTGRRETCDYPRCDSSFSQVCGMDHWFDVTEFDTDRYEERAYCSRECLINDQVRIAEDGPKQQVTIPREELRLIVDLANAARKIDDGRVAPLLGGSDRAMAARRATDKHDRQLRRDRNAATDGDRDE